jgi:hypothetical protein
MKNEVENLLKTAEKDENSSISSAQKFFKNSEESYNFFARLKREILNIDNWNKNGNLTSFTLFNQNGDLLPDTKISEEIFIRISLKGSGKYDWVRVIKVTENDVEMIITVQPTFDPTDKESDKSTTSHFFTSEATNNFCLLNHGNSVTFYVIGLNEKQNTQDTGGIIETIRNVAAANLGSYLGIQKAEWTTFCENFLNSKE